MAICQTDCCARVCQSSSVSAHLRDMKQVEASRSFLHGWTRLDSCVSDPIIVESRHPVAGASLDIGGRSVGDFTLRPKPSRSLGARKATLPTPAWIAR